MSTLTAYLLGLATLPGLAVALWVIGWLLIEVAAFFYARGWRVEFPTNRNTGRIPNATLRRDIWFEQQRGPIYTGHWYRESDEILVTRWLGIGNSNGASLMILKIRELGLLDEATP